MCVTLETEALSILGRFAQSYIDRITLSLRTENWDIMPTDMKNLSTLVFVVSRDT